MRLTQLPDGIPDLLPMQERSEGAHVSDIIRYLCIQLGHFEDAGDISDMEAEDQVRLLTRWQLGSAMERAIANRFSEHFPERYIQPGELSQDGLYLTPDLLDVEDYAVEEIKLTWMSTRHEPNSKKFWKYWVQLKAYCHVLQTGLGRLSVCFLNGNYRWGDPGASPVYRRWEAEFTRQELQENWNMLLKNKEAAMRYKGRKT